MKELAFNNLKTFNIRHSIERGNPAVSKSFRAFAFAGQRRVRRDVASSSFILLPHSSLFTLHPSLFPLHPSPFTLPELTVAGPDVIQAFLLRRDGRAVEGGGLENRWAKAPWVRILLPPPWATKKASGGTSRRDGRAGRRRSPAKRVYAERCTVGSNPTLSATHEAPRARPFGRARSFLGRGGYGPDLSLFGRRAGRGAFLPAGGSLRRGQGLQWLS